MKKIYLIKLKKKQTKSAYLKNYQKENNYFKQNIMKLWNNQ